MGACGCIEVSPEWKIEGKDGNAWLFCIYAGCNYCDAPAGLQVIKVTPENRHYYYPEIDDLPEFKTYNDGLGFVPIVDHHIARQHVKEILLGYEPENGVLDEIDCDTLAEEVFSDMRSTVFGTIEKFRREEDAI